MLSIIQAAGWPIWPLILCSVIALAIIVERTWSLRYNIVMPRNLLAQVVQEYRQNGVTPQMLTRLTEHSPLGAILAAGLKNVRSTPAIMKEAIEEAGRATAIELDRFLTSLGTISAIAPLLGLFGTVIGMIEIFGSQGVDGGMGTSPGGGNPAQLAHGISIALYNTAFGLIVAIPALIFWRYFRARVDDYLLSMELAAERFARHLVTLRR